MEKKQTDSVQNRFTAYLMTAVTNKCIKYMGQRSTLFYDKESGRYNFHYIDENGDNCDYGGIHCGEGFE